MEFSGFCVSGFYFQVIILNSLSVGDMLHASLSLPGLTFHLLNCFHKLNE